MIVLINLFFHFAFVFAEPLRRIVPPTDEAFILNHTETRRILHGHEVNDTRPYMVYLKPSPTADPTVISSNWLCGGVIIHERYILTSAACIEDVKNFYVISGTHRWKPYTVKNDDCVNYGAKRAIWKCVPKSYVYDGKDFDNIRWAIGDIAVVKVEDEFNFKRRVKGCDFIPKKVAYNNVSLDYEKAGTRASTAGWGSTERFSDVIEVARNSKNNPTLLETDVLLISKKNCKKRWPERYHYVIDQHMICGKDGTDLDAMTSACTGEVNCKDLVYSDEEETRDLRKQNKRNYVPDPDHLDVHLSSHFDETRRTKLLSGGFCENDHGGPLIVGYGKTAMVAGVISACQTRDITLRCYGPFLYTSVYQYRYLINCAIDRETGEKTCRKLLREQMSETTFSWSSHSEGPAKSEVPSTVTSNTAETQKPHGKHNSKVDKTK